MSDDPIKRFTLLVLFQAQQDRASELVLASSESEGAPIKYKVGDTWYDMSPPPLHILRGVWMILERLAGFADGTFPKKGTIDVEFSGVRLEWRIEMAGPGTACVLTPLRE